MFKNMKRFLLTVLVLALTVTPISVRAATELESPCENLSASATGSRVYGDSYWYYGYKATIEDGYAKLYVKSEYSSAHYGTLTLTNSGETEAVLSFSYTVSGTSDSCTIDGNSVSGTKTYSKTLAPDASVDISLTATKKKDATIELTNIKLVAVSSAKITVSHNGPGTVSVGGTVTESGSTVEVDAAGTTLLATPGTDAVFLGWINTADNSLAYTTASVDYVPTGDASLKAIFASPTTEACFWGSGKSYLFENLSGAITHASGASNKTIILAESGTLSSGNYTVPSDVTLLLPFDGDGTCYTTAPGYLESYAKPSAYITLTMASGANITVASSGAISVSAKVCTVQGSTGAPTGKYGHVAMNEGSSITVNSGGNLYAWGYITGSGSVTIKSGATVYESFQVVDWRGGTASSGMLNNSQKVFPMSQYFIQNVEVPMTLEAGASEQCSMVADIMSVRQVTVKFLGTSDCMFNLTSGSATKRYDGSSDRLVLDFDGDLAISQTEITLLEVLGMKYSIATKNYVLPLTNNIYINVNDGSTVTFEQSASLLPGVQVTIHEGGTITMGTGAQLYVYDETEWKANKYVFSDAHFRSVKYAPGKTYTRTADTDIVDAKIVVNGTLDASAGYLYTTASGANICSTANGVVKVQAAESSPTLYEAVQTGTTIAYESISIKSADLKNVDANYTATADYGAGTYYYIDGYWHYNTAVHVDSDSDDKCDYCPAVMVAQTNVSVDGTVTAQKFFYLQEAIEKTSDGYITMLADTTEDNITVDKTVYLDLNGCNVTGDITVAAGYILYGMDSTTNAMSTADYGVITGNISGEVANVYTCGENRHYLTVSTTVGGVTTTSFHRFRFGIDSYTYYIRQSTKEVVAITFSATYLGDDAAMAGMTRLGMEVNGEDVLFDPATQSDGLTKRTVAPTGYVVQRTVTDPDASATYTVSALLKVDSTVLESTNYFASVTVGSLGGT